MSFWLEEIWSPIYKFEALKYVRLAQTEIIIPNHENIIKKAQEKLDINFSI